jgi:hypothetical protein
MPTAARADAEHVSTSILIADDQGLVRAGRMAAASRER